MKRLRKGERCPLHGKYACCGRSSKGSHSLVTRRGPVTRIEDSHHSRGYRELCTPSELRRRKHALLAKDPTCWLCGEKFTDYREIELEHKEPKGMGGARRDDHRDNLAIDLYAGLGGWAEGFLAEGYRVIGFDIERHDYGTGGYPGQLVLQDVTTLHGSQFKDAAVIVASPPCQAYSYRAMPWKRAKALPPPDNTLFEACFRIQREASEAAGRHIPMVVENVRGAQKWVGRAKANFGSYYLWGDVGMVGRRVVAGVPRFGVSVQPMKDRKTPIGSWDLTPKNYTKDHSWALEEGATKVPGFRFDGSGRSFQTSAALKVASENGRRTDVGNGARFTTRDCGLEAVGIKQNGSGREWFAGDGKISRMTSYHSHARKAASAAIAKIPLPLAIHIAKCFKPACDPVARGGQ